jgi:3-oxoacyl-(acyl-carrier-protein) synthase
VPKISSTKSLTGHSLGATGVQEAIYCLLMLQDDFIAASANVDRARPGARSPARSRPSASTTPARHGDLEQLRLRRHQRHARLSRYHG